MELQDTFTSGEEETEIFENKFDDAEEQRSDGTAAVRDVQDSPGTAELHEVGSRNKKKTDTALERKIKRITEQFKAEKKSLTEEIERHKHTISQHEKEIARLKTFEDHQPNLIQEIDRLKTFESVHQAHKEQICNLKEELENAKTSQIKLENKLRQVDSEKSSLNGIVQGLRKDNLSLVEEKECLLLRLSKLAGAKLTLDNPNIADLSDQKRPTKLAEEFAELYDNEWTDAFEDVKTTNEQEKTAFMLKLLQRASEICRQVSYEHMDGMKKSICTLTVRTNPSDLSRRTLKSKQQINVRADSKVYIGSEETCRLASSDIF
ncbi:uncharacterized protein LOC128557453 [Mercenaria mercenaria]|uniref:uncharacterized protein LOC128557453 n=1 Tax=Mercenaria mercenaria TaxID=6596 RepID=UPI00234F27CD|nr:uncharacterized protein LOC128557453 [Mercenaria mercenaria]